ncbi:MAG: hypothetical protein Q8M47_09080 [Devosia sp.]|nr:hypothetical protein [Devosia sp.]
MSKILSTIVLITCATALALAPFAVGVWSRLAPAFWSWNNPGLIAIVLLTIPAAFWIGIAAVIGRRRPLLDGLSVITTVGLLLCIALQNTASVDYQSYVSDLLWTSYAAALTCIFPAWFVTYFALRHTPLLRGLVPDKTVA